jgi:kinesin family protein 3/17
LLAEKLAAIERNIIVGGENLLEKAELQSKLLDESEKQLEKQKAVQDKIKRQLEEKEVATQ